METKLLKLLLMMTLPLSLWAEQAYIIDQVKVGIHQSNSIDSPIVQLLNTGSTLQILQRGNTMTQITSETGVTGWIKNEYLMDQASSRDELEKLKKENLDLMQQLQNNPAETVLVDSDQNAKVLSLEQDLQAEKLRTGQLEAQILELKQKNSDNGSAEVYEHIAELEQENLNLQDQVEELLRPNGEGSVIQDLKLLFHRGSEIKRHLIYFIVLLVIGIVSGIFIHDYLQRQRHGGFRV